MKIRQWVLGGLMTMFALSTVPTLAGCAASPSVRSNFVPPVVVSGSDDERSAVSILAAHGFNYARIRLLVNPKTRDGLGQDLPYVIASAQEAKKNGMKILLDVFYSDYWCDPATNAVPSIWANDDIDRLSVHCAEYTGSVLAAMSGAGVVPDMVQVGNEVTDGMMWPLGKIRTHGWGNYIRLSNAGYDAVKAYSQTVGVEIPVMIQYAGTGAADWYAAFYGNGGRADVIGLSYYPMWHGSIASLVNTLKKLSAAFGKPLYVVETAAYWKTSEAHSSTMGYSQTPDGQYAFLAALGNEVKKVSGVQGIFYWGACWTQSSKWLVTNWTDDDAGCRGLFDNDGRALEAIDALRDANAGVMPVIGVDISEAKNAEAAGVHFKR